MKSITSFFLCACLYLMSGRMLHAQQTIDQNGMKSSVITALSGNGTEPRRYEVAKISINSFHWQAGGSIVVELFQSHYSPSFAKYIINLGYEYGANYGVPEVSLVDRSGKNQYARVQLGAKTTLPSTLGGYADDSYPLYVDVRDYGIYNVKISYMQNLVTQLTSRNQILINFNPTAVATPEFSVPQELARELSSTGTLKVAGNGRHYISDGNLGIGTKTPAERLSVNGKIRAHEIKVETAGWPDYVFQPGYDLKPLPEIEQYIQQHGHLPEVPKAEQVEADGLSVGEMNKLLMKKVEELTLHLIEHQKRIVELEEHLSKK